MSEFRQITHLSLYHFQACPFCAITREALACSDLDVDSRDIQLEPSFRSDLISGGGKSQVPCLRIDYDDGESLWLYESSAIIQFVRAQSAQALTQRSCA